VSDGPTPSPLKWELVAQDGDCKLLKPSTPFCDPTCGSEALCVADGECNAFPTPLDVGEVTIRGVSLQSGENQLVMTALPPSNNYQPIGKQLLYPPFDEGEEVVLESSGEGIAALNLRAFGVKPLVLSGEDPILLEPDTPLEISWVAAADSDASVIQATFDISHHGGQKGELVCETADDGTLTIAASLVTGLIDLGYSGFPSVHVIRKSVATQQTRVGKVQLVLQSTEERSLALPGLISCVEIDSPEGCPDGQTCKQDLKCAE